MSWYGGPKLKQTSIAKRHLAYDVSMTPQLKHLIRLLETIQTFSSFLSSFIHKFILNMQEKSGNKKRAITLQHIFWHVNIVLGRAVMIG